MIALLLTATALGLSNMAAAVGIGIGGVDGATRLRVALVFGLLEAGMPLVGLVAGHAVSEVADESVTRWLAGGLLAGVGCYQAISWLRSRGRPPEDAGADERGWSRWRLIASGLALSVDNLIVGFALGADHMALVTAVIVIGLVSVAMSLAGLEIGAKLGIALGRRGELAAGLILLVIGVLVAANFL